MARRIIARGIEQGDSRPIGCRPLAGQPQRQFGSGRSDLFGGPPGRGARKDLRRRLAYRAGLSSAADPGNAALFVERKPDPQRAAAAA